MYILRQYQKDAVAAGLACLKTGKRGILVLPTGSGKSLVIASIAEELGGRTIILQPTKEILEQNKDKMMSFGYRDIGIYSASFNKRQVKQITFATIGSVVRKKHLFEQFDRIIVDECHLVNSKKGMYENFINTLKLSVIGLTATPYRLKSYCDMWTGERVAESRILTRTRPRIFNKFAHITQAKDLFQQKYLCGIKYECHNDYNTEQIRSNSTMQGYDEKSLRTYNTKHQIPQKIIAAVATAKEKHILVFTQFCNETTQVLAGLKDLGITCAEVSAKTKKKERNCIIKNFKLGIIRCVTNVGVLTTGFDFPALDCIVIGRPTKSVSLYYQMTGRGVRVYPNKECCKMIDLCDNVNRFGKIENFEIYDSNGNEMWRLKSNMGNLTGVDITTKRNLEKVKYRK